MNENLKHITVVGKAADDLGMQCGGRHHGCSLWRPLADGQTAPLVPGHNEQLSVDHVAGNSLFTVGFGLTYDYLSRK